MTRRAWVALLLLAVPALAASCGDEETAGPTTPASGTPPAAAATAEGTAHPPDGVGADVPANLFDNGSFEAGRDPWLSLTTSAWGTPFEISSQAAHSGTQSAFLQMRAGPGDPDTRVFGVVQEIAPDDFPELLSGYYWVEGWERGTDKQYLQFVVIAWGATNLPSEFPNHQIRYPLAGISEPPFQLANARFLFVGTEEPQEGSWVYFERNIRQDFIDQWGAAPEGFSSIRFLFEVRYDGKAPGSELKADVFYDDLYIGPADANPNEPERAYAK